MPPWPWPSTLGHLGALFSRLPGILPAMSFQESAGVTSVYPVARATSVWLKQRSE